MGMTRKQRTRRKRRMKGETTPPSMSKKGRQVAAARARVEDAQREADWRRHDRAMRRSGGYGYGGYGYRGGI